LADQVGRANDMKHFIIILSDKGELEAIFGRIDGNALRSGITVEAMNDFAFDTGEVDGLIKGLDDAVITGKAWGAC
jgi:hypothetical protein